MTEQCRDCTRGQGSAERGGGKKRTRRKGSKWSLRRRQKGGGSQIKGEVCVCVCVSLDYAAPRGNIHY